MALCEWSATFDALITAPPRRRPLQGRPGRWHAGAPQRRHVLPGRLSTRRAGDGRPAHAGVCGVQFPWTSRRPGDGGSHVGLLLSYSMSCRSLATANRRQTTATALLPHPTHPPTPPHPTTPHHPVWGVAEPQRQRQLVRAQQEALHAHQLLPGQGPGAAGGQAGDAQLQCQDAGSQAQGSREMVEPSGKSVMRVHAASTLVH